MGDAISLNRPRFLGDGKRPLHAVPFMARLGAKDHVGPGGNVVDVELLRVACGYQLARGDAVVRAVAYRQVVLRAPRIDEPEDDLAVRSGDRPGIELVLRHRHLNRTPRRAATAAPAAPGKQSYGHKPDRKRSHLPAVIPT